MRAWATALFSLTTAVVIGRGAWHSGELPASNLRAAQSSRSLTATTSSQKANAVARTAKSQCKMPEDSFQADLRRLLKRRLSTAPLRDDRSCSVDDLGPNDRIPGAGDGAGK